MKTCGACGVENPDIARFCLACGTQLADAPAAQEMRKVVTIVFSDLKGSTSLGEALDSEALREVMTRYFDAMRGELERHGGVIEKFIGDAVMAVFGLPRLHEDDALRAVRAAAGMQSALESLNDELDLVYGVRLANRTGVNTGEVVAGDPTTGQRLVTGDAVNVAARLEQAAGEREVLLGALTYRLVRDSVEVDEVEPLTLKGKSEPVPAYRLIGVRDERTPEERRGVPFVGREHELDVLQRAYDDAVSTRGARLVTVLGDAGVGKTRLTGEFLDRVEGQALSLSGRCLPYGDGITFWPIAEAVRYQAGITDEDDGAEARRKLTAFADPAGDGVTDRIASAVGLALEPYPVEEVFWAVRQLLEHLAASQPVVFVVQDIHWAESTLLALLEHLVHSIRSSPVLLLCPARPDLLERLPDWGVGERAMRVALDPLGAEATRSMVEALLDGGSLEDRVLERVIEAADGNPLYVEQLVQMLIDEDALEQRDGAWHARGELATLTAPPSIQALLASRLDTLSSFERGVVEPASVVGYLFADDAITALVAPEISPRVSAELTSLERKRLVQRAEEEEDAHRFHHIMIRDTAYEGLLKRARADLHARFVAWADLANRDRGVEFEEILGYHLEQAWTYLSELGPIDERGREIGQEGARRLASAGRRAFARGDIPSAAGLLGRAGALLPQDDVDRIRLLPDYGEALLVTGRFDDAAAVLDEAMGYRRLVPAAAARASVLRPLVRLRIGDPDGWQREQVERDIAEAIEVFEREKDEAGLAMACRMLAWSAGTACRFGDAAEASARAIEHARRAGDVVQERRAATAYAGAASLGPTNVDEAIMRCESCLEQTAGNRQAEGNILAVLGGLYALQGSFDHARILVARARSVLEEIGLAVDAARVGLEAWRIEMLARDLDAAERTLRAAYDTLDNVGERWFLPTFAGHLAQTLIERGDSLDDARALVDRSRELTTDADVATQALWRSAWGRILARQGSLDEAEQLVREALTLLEPTDATMYQLEANLDLGEVLEAAGRYEEARGAYEAARKFAELKGGVVLVTSVIRRLEAVDTAPA